MPLRQMHKVTVKVNTIIAHVSKRHVAELRYSEACNKAVSFLGGICICLVSSLLTSLLVLSLPENTLG